MPFLSQVRGNTLEVEPGTQGGVSACHGGTALSSHKRASLDLGEGRGLSFPSCHLLLILLTITVMKRKWEGAPRPAGFRQEARVLGFRRQQVRTGWGQGPACDQCPADPRVPGCGAGGAPGHPGFSAFPAAGPGTARRWVSAPLRFPRAHAAADGCLLSSTCPRRPRPPAKGQPDPIAAPGKDKRAVLPAGRGGGRVLISKGTSLQYCRVPCS